jgi:putative transposase
MSETLDPVATELDQRQLAEQLLAQAKEQGVELVGPNGLLNQLTKNVLETALDAEMAEHLGYDKHDPAGRGSGNSRNGTRAKTVFTEIGPVEIEVPRDTNSSFEPQIVKKRQRRLSGIDEIVLSLTAKGLTTGEIAAHFADIYGVRVSKDTISRITDKVIADMAEWCIRWCSSMRSSSRSVTARSPIGRSMWPLGSPAPASATSSACGPATVVRGPSFGWRC